MRNFLVGTALWAILACGFVGCGAKPDESGQPKPSESGDGPDPARLSISTDTSDLLEALKSDDESARLAAIDTLGLPGQQVEGAIAALIGQLGDDSATVRAHAAHALGQIGPTAKPAAEALAKLVADEDSQVRREAVRAFGRIRPGPEVSIPLFTKVLEEAEPEVRVHAMNAMAQQGKEVVPPLIEALSHEEAGYWACLVLAEIGADAEQAVPALVKLFQSDDRPEVCREALLAIAAIGPGAASAVPDLIGVIGDDEELGDGAAVYALGAIGPEAKAAAEKVRALADQEDAPAFLRTICLWALARMDPEDEQLVGEVVPQLVEALKSPESRLRAAAARALLDLDPDPEIVRPVLTKVMEEASAEALDDMLDALASLGEKAVPRLIKALETEEVRPKAAAIIARIGPAAKEAVPTLIDALSDETPETRNEVLFALAAIGPGAEAAVAAATEALGDPEMNVRYAACYALGKIGSAAMPAKAKLQENLAAEDEFLAMASAWALACIHPECPDTPAKSVPVLIEALGRPDRMNRLQAAESLQHLGALAKDAVDALKKAAGDDDEQVRQAAARALEAVGG